MTAAYFRRMWESDFRTRLRLSMWIGCDKDWRPAPYSGCKCFSCELMRELRQGDRL